MSGDLQPLQSTPSEPGQPLSERERLLRLLGSFHTTLMVVLIALRPLVWDGDAASPANLVYLALIQLALLVTAGEFVGGLRTTLRWSWTGLVFAGLVLALVPASLRAPIPATGSAFMWQLLMHLGLGAYLLQILPGRERVAWSALIAGLGAEVAIGWVQGLYVLPKMADDSAQGDAAVAAEGIAANDLLERIRRGGWFGTFTLSNALAAWLLLTVIPLLGAAWQRGAGRLLWIALALSGSGLFLATRSKGALIAALVVGGVWWLVYQRRWWRWLPLPLGMVAVCALFLVPGWSDGVDASARVRWGYWSGAITLVREAPFIGLGIGAFAERSAGVLPLWAEPSRLVHNEPLETAVVAGLPVALLLVALLVLLAWPRRDEQFTVVQVDNGADSGQTTWLTPLALIVITAYLCLLGMLDGNLGWWPGGEGPLGQAAWGVVVGLWMAMLLRLTRGLQPVPKPWLRLAVAALVVHSLIDFDLHSFAVVGTLITVAVLAGSCGAESCGTGSCCIGRQAAERRVGRGLGLVMLVAIFALGFGWLQWAHTALELRHAQDIIRALRLTRDPLHADDGFSALANQMGVAEPSATDNRARTELLHMAVTTGLSQCATDPTTAVQLISIMPPSAARLAQLDALWPRLPYALSLARLRAQDYLVAGRWLDAVSEMRRGLALAPAYIPARQEFEGLLEQIANRDPDHADQWRAARTQAAAERVALEPLVDFRNRKQ